MKRNQLSWARRRLGTPPIRNAVSLSLEPLEERRVLSTTSPWVPLVDLDQSATQQGDSSPPVADPAVLVAAGNDNTDAASLLAAGGPGDPSLPGFANVSSSGNYGTVVYLGAGWAITASHVALTSSINFGGTSYTVDMSSVHQLHNADNSLTDLKMFRVEGEPQVPELLSSYIATTAPSGHVFMIGNGLTRNQQLFWSVNKTQSPWVWTEISEPAHPNSNNYAGVSITGAHAVRWGENNVDLTGLSVTAGSLTITGFTTQFDYLPFTGQVGLPNEAQGSNGDSGGAVFSFVNGKWVLSGLMIAISGPLSGQPSNTALYGNFTLMIDLSAYRNEILSTIGVADQQVFYNNSNFDGNNSSINASDDLAIATDKTAYLPDSGSATLASVTNYVRGINGIMVDLASTHGTITASDFAFKVGTSNSPGTWATAPAPASISVRSGAGVGGSDRIEITWPDGAISNTWLEVTLKGNDAIGGSDTNTGLSASDVFYFGNRIGDAGFDPAGLAVTNASDEIAVRLNPGFDEPITSPYDFNRDQLVNANDQIIARLSTGFLALIDVSTSAAAPVAVPTSELNAVGFGIGSQRPRIRIDNESTAIQLDPDWQLVARQSSDVRSRDLVLAQMLEDASIGQPLSEIVESLDLAWLSEMTQWLLD